MQDLSAELRAKQEKTRQELDKVVSRFRAQLLGLNCSKDSLIPHHVTCFTRPAHLRHRVRRCNVLGRGCRPVTMRLEEPSRIWTSFCR